MSKLLWLRVSLSARSRTIPESRRWSRARVIWRVKTASTDRREEVKEKEEDELQIYLWKTSINKLKLSCKNSSLSSSVSSLHSSSFDGFLNYHRPASRVSMEQSMMMMTLPRLEIAWKTWNGIVDRKSFVLLARWMRSCCVKFYFIDSKVFFLVESSLWANNKDCECLWPRRDRGFFFSLEKIE